MTFELATTVLCIKIKILFLFYIEFILYDLNRTVNEEIGREVFDFYGFSTAMDNNIVISFKNVSRIFVLNTEK